MTRVLVVEDEEHLAAGLKFNLEAEVYAVDVEENGQTALDRLKGEAREFHLVLLDVMLPGLDGFEVVRRLRDAGKFIPVMILTARGESDDVARGFEAGADDYLPKPFDLAVLFARMQALLRRKEWLERSIEQSVDQRQEGGHQTPLEDYLFSGKQIDFARQVIVHNGAEHALTVMEATLLRYLVEREGVPVDRKALLEDVWGVRKDTDTRTVDNFIARLRRYIEDEPSKPRHLETVRGVGYRFVATPKPKI